MNMAGALLREGSVVQHLFCFGLLLSAQCLSQNLTTSLRRASSPACLASMCVFASWPTRVASNITKIFPTRILFTLFRVGLGPLGPPPP